MKYSWLHKTNAEQLILYFNGWSCDEKPFQFLKSKKADVLMFYDYRSISLPEEVLSQLDKYSRVYVVAWSFGVWVAQMLMYPIKHKIYEAIAINGTLKPLDIECGIPLPIAMGTLAGLSEVNLEKFHKRMFCHRSQWERFNNRKPERLIDDVKNELFLLYQHFKVQKLQTKFYNKAIIGSEDRIFSSENQMRYWERNNTRILKLKQGHFCFYEFTTWQDIISL
ncbi:DUF452 family protein [Carboxylicivirga sp. M1479]|uniref:DUF452 family protein n=1 Tax=Carboxylicivirga sp. M1479 TaxID=2594476 RepID=UPI001177BE93|nr:pimeloyl-ACP methyl esterase BioG family protein [Carboxylicivirga sp. M1479]TRX64266.1 DUF452 family protein [Carboxylicivirga sp. M1479]